MPLPLSHKITVSTSPKLKLGHDDIGLQLTGRKALLPMAFKPLIQNNDVRNLAVFWETVARRPELVAKVTGWTEASIKQAVTALGNKLAKVLTTDELGYIKDGLTPPVFSGGGYMLEPPNKTKLAASERRKADKRKAKHQVKARGGR